LILQIIGLPPTGNRLQKAEVVVEVAKDTCEELWGHGLIAIEALQKALDDLEGQY
jgi:hypothetical protein